MRFSSRFVLPLFATALMFACSADPVPSLPAPIEPTVPDHWTPTTPDDLGPVSIDPQTRDIVQTVYIRRVEKVGGELRNVEFDKVENVKDPVKERMKK